MDNESPGNHFNPLAPYGARRRPHWDAAATSGISIHSPRTGRDTIYDYIAADFARISIHSPRTGRDLSRTPGRPPAWLFQSTRPVRGETSRRNSCFDRRCHFNPLAPYGARPAPRRSISRRKHFNPLAPYGARPEYSGAPRVDRWHFNPLAPYGARQQKCTS